MYIFYGLVAGFSQFTPLSASAHQALFPLLFRFDSIHPLLRLFVHGGALVAVWIVYRQKISHLYRQTQLAMVPAKQRKRMVDSQAVMDGKLIINAGIPALIGSLLSGVVANLEISFLLLSVLLIGMGIMIYLPTYMPGGNRNAKFMIPMEAFLLGTCVGASIIPGISAVGLFMAVALLRKCDRVYMLDIAVLVVGIALGGMMVADLIGLVVTGFSGISLIHLVGCILAAGASLCGGLGAITTMRFLAVKTGFSSFALYSWGLGLLSFMIYLMV